MLGIWEERESRRRFKFIKDKRSISVACDEFRIATLQNIPVSASGFRNYQHFVHEASHGQCWAEGINRWHVEDDVIEVT